MTIERRNPIPTGRYWIDLFAFDKDDQIESRAGNSQVPAFTAWAKAHGVRITTTETERLPTASGLGSRTFVIFEVTTPAERRIPQDIPSFPEIAPGSVQTSDDTAQKPDPPQDVFDSIAENPFGLAKEAAFGLGLALGVGLLALFVIKKNT